MEHRTNRYWILLVLGVALTVGAMAPLAQRQNVGVEATASRGATTPASPRVMAPVAGSAGTPTLKTIRSRIERRGAVISIEASEQVSYIASQPEPRLFVIELRGTSALTVANRFTPDRRHPFSIVQVESDRAEDGASIARVRMTLAQPLRPRVRTARNMIYVEADRLDRGGRAAARLDPGPSSAIREVRVVRRGAATAVTLYATGRLSVSGVTEAQDGTPRLTIDLPNATSAVAATTPVGQGPVEAVRISAADGNAPRVARVVMDLNRQAPYRLEPSANGNDLTVIFDEPASGPVAAPIPTAAALQGPAPTLQAPPPVMQVAQAQPPPPPLVPAIPATQVADAPRFTGTPVSLDFQGADLRAVLRTFAEISGLNVVIDPTIQGTVDVTLRDVPWDQALDIILRANRLGYVVDGTIVRVVPLTVLAEEQAERQKLAEAQALAGDLQTIARTLSYARAEQVQPLLIATVLSQRGSITTDVRTNTLIITDLADRLVRAGDLVTTLDRPEPQVEIEARIVETTRDFARQLGVQWGFNGRAAAELGNTLPLAFPNQVALGGRMAGPTSTPGNIEPGSQATQGVTPADAAATAVNLGVQGATTGIGLALGAINGAVNLDVALSALEEAGQGRLLSTPRVTTQNNVEAQITQGVQIPIQTVANNTVTVTFRDAALTLLVTPQITAVNTVIMKITVENAAPDYTRSVNNIPPIDTQRAITQLLVNDGETSVIGGIYVSREQTQQARTPALYRLPLLGWLFQRNIVRDQSRELLIFITPRIIRQ